MTTEQARIQAEKLQDFVARGGSTSRWFASKGFSKADRARITQESLLIAQMAFSGSQRLRLAVTSDHYAVHREAV